MKLKVFLALAALPLALGACQPAAKAPAPVTVEQSAQTAAKLSAQGGALTGVLSEANDAGYPMYALVFTLDGGAKVEALFNNEAATIEGEVEALVGKPVAATIAIVSEPSLLQLHAKGKLVKERELGPDQKLEIPTDAQKVTGILSGAAEPSGDLPSRLTITARDGAKTEFREFFDEDLAALDGKEVTLTYDIYRFADVTALAPAPLAEKK